MAPMTLRTARPRPAAAPAPRRRVPLALALALALAGCPGPGGLRVGDASIPGSELDAAAAELRVAFGSFGTDTLRWALLDEGKMGPAALLHHRLAAASAAALAEAERCADRLRRGEEFDRLLEERETVPGGAQRATGAVAPSPFWLGGSVAAKVATLEPGQWAGPVQTLQGWEIVRLRDRADPVRSRAHVQVDRLVFPVGTAEDQERAKAEWTTLPLSGDRQYLDALLCEFRRGRVAAAPGS